MVFLANAVIRRLNELPELKEGELCEPNKVYRVDCNTCRCQEDLQLTCTKMACLTEEQLDKVRRKVQLHLSEEEHQNEPESRLPDLPGEDCVPGKVYQKDCYGCYCQHDKTVLCSKKRNACDPNHPQVPFDVRPALQKDEVVALPSLPHTGARCDPGYTYSVDCNICLCLASRSLFCDKKLCLSHEDINRIEAKKKTGTPCKADEPLPTSKCVECSCSNNTALCRALANCARPLEALRQYHGAHEKIKPTLALDVKGLQKKKCLPNAVYKVNCNKCYCQKDSTLRCTQKTCLSYLESLKLKRHRLRLQKQGL